MAGKAKKTEHAGPKKGSGAYWGRKGDAKRESNRVRRERAKRTVWQGLTDSAGEWADPAELTAPACSDAAARNRIASDTNKKR